MADCDGSLHARARAGLVLINEGHYFEAHEELEAAWKEEKGKVRQLYQGILEAATAELPRLGAVVPAVESPRRT